jgi:hypothetical protein
MGHRVPYSPLPIELSEVSYEHGPDSSSRADVPSGRTTRWELRDPRAYPGTRRDVWVHVPSSAPGGPLPVIVFQDGAGFLDPDDEVARVRQDALATGKGEFVLEATLTDADGEIVASTVGTYQVRRLG